MAYSGFQGVLAVSLIPTDSEQGSKNLQEKSAREEKAGDPIASVSEEQSGQALHLMIQYQKKQKQELEAKIAQTQNPSEKQKLIEDLQTLQATLIDLQQAAAAIQ